MCATIPLKTKIFKQFLGTRTLTVVTLKIGEMAQYVKVLANKSDDLHSTPRTYRVEAEATLISCPPTSTHVHTYAYTLKEQKVPEGTCTNSSVTEC